MIRSIDFYPPSVDRRTDIAVVKGNTLRVFNQMRGLIQDFPFGQEAPEDPATVFLFGGFSWRNQRFRIWKLHYDSDTDAFTYRPTNKWPGQTGMKVVAFAGDAIDDAHDRLVTILRERRKLTVGGFDMEPFEVLRDMIRSTDYPTIGGAPQVAKVYKYLRTQFFAVRWPDNSGVPHALGRPALGYERFEAPVIDPDAPSAHSSRQIIDQTTDADAASADDL